MEAELLEKLNSVELDAAYKQLLALNSRVFDLQGYCSFHELISDLPPAAHHIAWVKDALAAIRSGRETDDEEPARVLIEAPPESAKSTVFAVLWPTWRIGHKPLGSSMILSVSDDQGQERATACAEIIASSDNWKMAFPDVVPWRDRGWGVEKGYWVKELNPDGSDNAKYMTAVKTQIPPSLWGGGYRNRAIIGKRVSRDFICDDILDEANTRSETELNHVNDIVAKTISSRPTRGALLLFIGTPWVHSDTYHKLEESGLYRVHILPALNSHGESYWTTEWSLKRLESKRKELELAGSGNFELMYLMDRKAAEGKVLKAEWLSTFPAEDISEDWPIFYGVDPVNTSKEMGLTGPRKKKGDPDWFVIAKWKIAPWGAVLYDGVREQISGPDAEMKLRQHAGMDNPVAIGIETDGGGAPFYQQVLYGAFLPLVPISTKGKSQSSRLGADPTSRYLNSLAMYFKHHRARLSDAPNKFLVTFKHEWIRYPGKWDDTLTGAHTGLLAKPEAVGSLKSNDGHLPVRLGRQKTPYDEIFARMQ